MNNFYRTEPLCVTCDLGDVLWSSRYYYINCSHFDAFVSPLSSIATEIGVDYYILECQGKNLTLTPCKFLLIFFYISGPGLPLSGMNVKFLFILISK